MVRLCVAGAHFCRVAQARLALVRAAASKQLADRIGANRIRLGQRGQTILHFDRTTGSSPTYVAELGYSYFVAGDTHRGRYKREFGSEEEALEFVRDLKGKTGRGSISPEQALDFNLAGILCRYSAEHSSAKAASRGRTVQVRAR